jgi:hypothetical protein
MVRPFDVSDKREMETMKKNIKLNKIAPPLCKLFHKGQFLFYQNMLFFFVNEARQTSDCAAIVVNLHVARTPPPRL